MKQAEQVKQATNRLLGIRRFIAGKLPVDLANIYEIDKEGRLTIVYPGGRRDKAAGEPYSPGEIAKYLDEGAWTEI